MGTRIKRNTRPGSLSELALLSQYYEYEQMEYDGNNNPIYLGYHHDIDADDGDTKWWVWKLTWDVNLNCTKIQRQWGSWTNRASLGW